MVEGSEKVREPRQVVLKRRFVFGFAAVVSSVPLLAFSCTVNQTFTDSGMPKVQFEGDSITFQAVDDINAHDGAAYDVAIDAYEGATTYEDQASVSRDAALHPDVVVINLGTNDAKAIVIGRYLTHPDGSTSVFDPIEPLSNVEARLQTMIDEFVPACVVMVTINDQDPAFYGGDATQLANATALNAWIRGLSGVQVADWNANLQPSYFDLDSNGVPKAPHPNEAGRQAMLALEDQATSRCPPSPTTSTTASGTTTGARSLT